MKKILKNKPILGTWHQFLKERKEEEELKRIKELKILKEQVGQILGYESDSGDEADISQVSIEVIYDTSQE